MPRAKQLQQDTHTVHQAHFQSEKLAEHSNLLTDVKSEQNSTNTKLDQFSGAINNSSIGDGTVKLQTYIYGHDSTAGQARALKVDSSGRLECNVADIELHTGDIALSVDGLETLITTTNTKLQSDLDFAGQPNSIGDGQNMKRTMNYGHDSSAGQQRPLKVDGEGHLQVDCLSSALPTGGATEAKQDVLEATLTNIETSAQLIDDTVTAQSAAHPSKAFAVGGRYYADNTFRDIRVDNIGKVIIDTPTGSDLDTRLATIGTNTTGLNNCVSGNELQVDVVSGTINASVSGVATEAKQDIMETSLNAIQTAVEGTLTVGSHNVTNAGTFATQATVQNPFNGVVTNAGTFATQATVQNPFNGVVTNAGTFATQATIQNSSIAVTDNGGSLTVDNGGTFATQATVQNPFNGVVTNAGTFAVQSTIQNSSIAVTDNGGSLTIDNADLSTIAGDTTSLDGKITQGNDSTLTNAQQVLIYGKNGTGDLKPVHITNNGDVEIEIADFVKGQALMAASFPVVISSDQSIINVLDQKTYSTLTTVDAALAVNASSNSDSSVVNNTDYNSVYQLQVVCSDAAYTSWTADIFQSIDASNFYKTFEDLNNGPSGPQSKLLTIVDRPASSWKLNIQNTGASNKTFAIKFIKA